MSDYSLPDLKARITLDSTDLVKVSTQAKQTKEDLDGIGKGDDPVKGRLQGIKAAGDELGKIGDKLSVGVTLPLVGIATAATKASLDFDQAFTNIVAQVGLSREEVDKMRGSVLQLSGQTAKAPQELADALFFITSAGLQGQDALDALEASAKASAAGLGQTEVVADAVTSAMNAYGPSVLSAGAATDVLVATVQAGKVEAAQLSASIGAVVPVANQMGVSFADAGGAVALLTRNGSSAGEAVTGLNGLLLSMLRPTATAKEALDGVGLSSQQLRDSLKNEGLVATLDLLKSRFGDNTEAIGAVIGSQEGLQAALTIMNASAETVAGTFGVVADSAGATGAAFDTVAKTDSFKLQEAMANLQAALIEIGAKLAPVISDLASGVGTVISVFSSLPGPVQTAIVVLAGFVAGVGPVLSIGKRIEESVNLVRSAFSKMAEAAAGSTTSTGGLSAAMAGLNPAILLAGTAAAAAAVAYQSWSSRKADLKALSGELAGAIRDETKAIDDSVKAVALKRIEDKGQLDDLDRIGVSLDTYTDAVLGNAEAQRQVRRALVETGEVKLNFEGDADRVRELTDAFIQYGDRSQATLSHNPELLKSFEDLTSQMGKNGEAAFNRAVVEEKLTDAQRDQIIAQNTQTGGLVDWGTALEQIRPKEEEHAETTEQVATSYEEATKAVELTAKQVRELSEVFDAGKALVDGYSDAIDQVGGESRSLESANLAAIDSQQKLNEAAKTFKKEGLDPNTEAGRDNRQQILDTTDAQLKLAEAMVTQQGDTAGATKFLHDYANGLAATLEQAGLTEDQVRSYLQTLGLTPSQIDTLVQITNDDVAKAKIDDLQKKIDALPDDAQVDIQTLVDQGEYDKAQAALDELAKNRTVTITATTVNRLQSNADALSFGIEAHAGGGQLTAGVPSLVGERGPELILPNMNAAILTAGQTRGVLGGGGRVEALLEQIVARSGLPQVVVDNAANVETFMDELRRLEVLAGA